MTRLMILMALVAFSTPAIAGNDFETGQMDSQAYAAFGDPINAFDPNAIEPASGEETSEEMTDDASAITKAEENEASESLATEE
ncbi:MAG TPA: hypothetical protein PLK94_10750 [Alphaproteobacteria bacterium]|nr:hypothetical protein [Alphaproteobacteria bacterium]HOO51753.1 hypothetical protein [Alphaproteobacteria bacterium]